MKPRIDDPSPAEAAKVDPWLTARLAEEKDPGNFIAAPLELSRPSKLLAVTIKAIAAAGRESAEHLLRRPPHIITPESSAYRNGLLVRLPSPALALRVSPASAERAIRLMDALIKACEVRNLAISIDKQAVFIGCQGHLVRVRIAEQLLKTVASAEAPRTSRFAHQSNVMYSRTGILFFSVRAARESRETSDKKKQPLEQQLNAVVANIYREIADAKFAQGRADSERSEWKVLEDARELKEATMQARKVEADELRQRIAELVVESAAWQQSRTVLAYADHLSAVATLTDAPISAELRAWIEWAKRTAKSMDPTNGRVAPERGAGQLID